MFCYLLLQVISVERMNMNTGYSSTLVILALVGVICHATALMSDGSDVQKPGEPLLSKLRAFTDVVSEGGTLDDQLQTRLNDMQMERLYQPEIYQERETGGSQEVLEKADQFDVIERREPPSHDKDRADGKHFTRLLEPCKDLCYTGPWALQSTCHIDRAEGGTRACCLDECHGTCSTGGTWWGIDASCNVSA